MQELHDSIVDFHQLQFNSTDATIVYLGDYIDGGMQSIQVIDRLISGVKGFKTICLLGNHEEMMLNCIDTNDPVVWKLWLSNGGQTTLDNLGITSRVDEFDCERLRTTLGEKRVTWLRSLPLFKIAKPYLFVHAGIKPGIPIHEQDRHDLLWIRGRFLDSNLDHGFQVVHGHTPSDDPIVKSNRICIDVGATSNGVLIAAVLDCHTKPLFLRSIGEPIKV